ncbi:hypothetical protein BGW36DRAFT_74497 [Talaromyces proteolyticus]|uniref:Uncharacterized protein n=1 Tax=Talaromyces proteolyticus TaxID=1131652 RepID=A0AAD4PSU9_9EURO|nr:uncharacterized protein BGW36DRAFT_74497 [Talaromyces proteolyticus]KAH8689668.1 hypothetical protein BGW36DRAFT_74497 [Talaromyces proteolyticus]
MTEPEKKPPEKKPQEAPSDHSPNTIPQTTDFRGHIFVGQQYFNVSRPLVRASSNLLQSKTTECLDDEEDPSHLVTYLSWTAGNGIPVDQQTKWSELGDLWFFGDRIEARQFQDALILQCIEKRRQEPYPLSEFTINYFFSEAFPPNTKFHTFLIDTYFLTTPFDVPDYDNVVFRLARDARWVSLSELVLQSERDADLPNFIFDYLVVKPSPNDKKGDELEDNDLMGRTHGQVDLKVLKRILRRN